MTNKLKISILIPCHENWQDMEVAERGRFCSLCQKHVIDFTKASDTQIAQTFKKKSNLCGRFLSSQLNRELVVPKEKSSLWIASSVAVIGFFTLGNYQASAQNKQATVLESKKHVVRKKNAGITPHVISGLVISTDSLPLAHAIILNRTLVKKHKQIFTDFSISAFTGDAIEISDHMHELKTIKIDGGETLTIVLAEKKVPRENISYMLGGAQVTGIQIVTVKRTFFGSIFNSMGSIFRKNNP